MVLAQLNVSNSLGEIEVPVFRVNFYMMGLDEVSSDITINIRENIEFLNQEFEGRIIFEMGDLKMHDQHGYIPDIHQDYLQKNKTKINELISPVEEKGGINVFLFETYLSEDSTTAMMGFTPILSAQHKKYEAISPQFDRLFIAYPGLSSKTTIVHEMGHFLGLSHPWDMNSINRDLMGFYEEGSERNHMTYHPEVNHFSQQQLYRMQHFALNFRRYLVKEVRTMTISNQAFSKYNTPRNKLN